MAWTTPGTATAGEVLTAAFWNEQVRDNTNALYEGAGLAPICTYVWSTWNPTNNTGTNTNAPATSVHNIANATYFTQSNSSGTLTVTCKIAGYYKVTAGLSLAAASAFTSFRGTIVFAGTSTIYDPDTDNTLWVSTDSASDNNQTTCGSYILLATANQTVTILPSGNVSSSAAASFYTLRAWSSVEFMGGSLA